MDKTQAKARIKEYFKTHCIEYYIDIDEGATRYTMVFNGYDKSPDNVIEGCIWFFENNMEVRIYYTKTASDWCKENIHNHPKLMRLFNYINAYVWPKTADITGSNLYTPHCLYTPRLYMTEDGCCDITLTTCIPYDFYEVAPVETEDYITITCPNLLNILSFPIFSLLIDKMSFDQAAEYVNYSLIEK